MNPDITKQWAEEAEDRLATYRRGELCAIPMEEVLSIYAANPTSDPLRRALDSWHERLRSF
jgi:hypothetical protein